MTTRPIRLSASKTTRLAGRTRWTASSTHQDSIWRIYRTTAGRERAATFFKALGYRYLVFWKDTNGWGLEAEHRADWQPKDRDCPVYEIR